MDGDPTPALTGRRRTRPTSPGCRNPQQPEPGRAPLISAKPAVQSNRATSGVGLRLDGLALNLQQPAFEVSLLCGGLMSAPPSRPSNDEGWLNAPLRQSDRYAPDFLHRPGNRQAWR